MATQLERQIAEVYAAARGNRKKVREVAVKEREKNGGRTVGMKKLAKAIREDG